MDDPERKDSTSITESQTKAGRRKDPEAREAQLPGPLGRADSDDSGPGGTQDAEFRPPGLQSPDEQVDGAHSLRAYTLGTSQRKDTGASRQACSQ